MHFKIIHLNALSAIFVGTKHAREYSWRVNLVVHGTIIRVDVTGNLTASGEVIRCLTATNTPSSVLVVVVMVAVDTVQHIVRVALSIYWVVPGV